MFSKQEQKSLIFYSSKDLENTEIIKWKRKINVKSINSFLFCYYSTLSFIIQCTWSMRTNEKSFCPSSSEKKFNFTQFPRKDLYVRLLHANNCDSWQKTGIYKIGILHNKRTVFTDKKCLSPQPNNVCSPIMICKLIYKKHLSYTL